MLRKVTMSSIDASPQIINALGAYVRALRARFGDRLADVLLFGSQARGDAGDASDVDVMVILDHPVEDELGEARGLAFDIWLAFQVLLSVRVFSRQSWQALGAMRSLFYRNIVRDGISLISTSPERPDLTG